MWQKIFLFLLLIFIIIDFWFFYKEKIKNKIFDIVAIVIGISGSGKTNVIKTLEDIDFYSIDNLPIKFIPNILENFFDAEKSNIKKIAFGIDSREINFLEKFEKLKDYLSIKKKEKKTLLDYKILFIDASDKILCRRFQETRRKHPLNIQNDSFLEQNIKKERDILMGVIKHADKIIDTSDLSVIRLKTIIKNYFNYDSEKIIINIISFGFKYGLPYDVSMMFDVRFLPNPYYVDELKNLTGNDEKIVDFVLNNLETKKFVEKLLDFIFYLIPLFIKEGKNYISFGVGCTGGKHRSVVITNLLAREIKNKFLHNTNIIHRDINKWF